MGARNEDSGATGVNGDETNGSTDAGAAYVFLREGTNWTQQAYLKASNTDARDTFGQSVGISGDTIAVGASGERSSVTGVNGDDTDDTLSYAGAAYVFVRQGIDWSQQAYLKASNTEASDQFGYDAAISGERVIVGAVNEDSRSTGVNGDQSDNTATTAGAAYVFSRAGTSWSQQAYLKASNTDPHDMFGWSVAVSDGLLAVGAGFESSAATGIDGDQADNSASGAGAAYVFTVPLQKK